ncbi:MULTISPECIES: hypothetical protein [unclassified Paenibacillus]
MRSLLITLLLIITAILIYEGVAGGENGMNTQVNRSGGAMSQHIRQLSP